MPQDIIIAMARRLDVAEDDLRPTFETVVQRIRQQVGHYGYARVAGLGTFRSRDGALTFEPDAVLAEMVNHRYSGLGSIPLGISGAAMEADGSAAAVSPAVPPAETERIPEAHTLAELDEEESSSEPAVDEAHAPQPEDTGARTTAEAEEDVWSEAGDNEPWSETGDDESWNEAEAEGVWNDAEDDDGDHPLGSFPSPEYEEADYAVVEEEAEDEHDDVLATHPEPPLSELEFDDEVKDDPGDEDGVDAEAGDTGEGIPLAADSTPEEGNLRDEPESLAAAGFSSSEEGSSSRTADRRARPHESIRREWPSERLQGGGLGASASRRNTILIGAGILILVAAAAVAYFSLQPSEPAATDLAGPTEQPGTAELRPDGADLQPDEGAPGPDERATDALGDEDGGDELASASTPDAPVQSASPLRSTEGIDLEADGYTIIVFSETSESAADNVAQEYGAQGFRTGVIRSQEGAARYRVGVGQFATLEEAAEARDQLAGNELPQDAWVHRLQ